MQTNNKPGLTQVRHWTHSPYRGVQVKILYIAIPNLEADPKNSFPGFDVLLTVQLNIILVINQLNAQILVL